MKLGQRQSEKKKRIVAFWTWIFFIRFGSKGLCGKKHEFFRKLNPRPPGYNANVILGLHLFVFQEHETTRRRKSKAQFFEMIQEIRR
jgi:hypothetical protein